MTDVTRILSAIEQGDSSATEQLMPLVYDELRAMAAAKMAQERPGQSLQATALVHEAYLRLVGNNDFPAWKTRAHFFGAAAQAMRRILIEQARRKQRLRHGGSGERIDLDIEQLEADKRDARLIELDEALERLEIDQPIVAEVVKLRYFAGLTIAETAAALELGVRTANRHWAYAKARLFRELHSSEE
jgi:RNA polymerase sigma factor (TIGR02999 family)